MLVRADRVREALHKGCPRASGESHAQNSSRAAADSTRLRATMRTKTEPGTFPTHLPGVDAWSPRQRPAPEGGPGNSQTPHSTSEPSPPRPLLLQAGPPGSVTGRDGGPGRGG